MKKTNLSLDATVLEITKALKGNDKIININSYSGDIIIEIGKKDRYDTIFDQCVKADPDTLSASAESHTTEYHFTLPDIHKASDHFRMLYAVEICSCIMVYESIGAIPFQEYIDAMNIAFFDYNLGSGITAEEVAEEFCKHVLKTEDLITRDLAKQYFDLRYNRAYQILLSDEVRAFIIRSAGCKPEDANYYYYAMGILTALKAIEVKENA